MRYFVSIAILAATFLITGCAEQTSKKASLREKIAHYSDSLTKMGKANQDPEEHRKTAKNAVENLKNYVNNYPKDSLTPDYLYQIGNIYRSHLGKANKAVNYYQKLVDQYPDHERAPFALFTQAFVFENNRRMKDLEIAESKYKTFIEEYPDHELTEDAKQSLDYLGLSGEEQLERIRRKRKDTANQEG